jgi:DNA-binding NtrC family response regulator
VCGIAPGLISCRGTLEREASGQLAAAAASRQDRRTGTLTPIDVLTIVAPMVARGRVLIADDEPDILDVLQEMVTAFGYEVATAVQSTAVVEVDAVFRPDVILLDQAMPGLSGSQVLAALRRADVQAPVIAITGHQDFDSAGFFAIIEKPVGIRVLKRTLDEAIGRRSGG